MGSPPDMPDWELISLAATFSLGSIDWQTFSVLWISCWGKQIEKAFWGFAKVSLAHYEKLAC